jgi:hypothetical protein
VAYSERKAIHREQVFTLDTIDILLSIAFRVASGISKIVFSEIEAILNPPL